MTKKKLVVSHNIKKGVLDDDYTLYEDGEVLHEYDQSTYPGGYNKTRHLTVNDLSPEIKQRLLNDSKEENKEVVKNILGL